MAKVKLSKTELKHQRDSLKRFTRFLPTLQLKKQQLQGEILRVGEELRQHRLKIEKYDRSIAPWVELMSSNEFEQIPPMVEVERVRTDIKNIAGVDIPVLERVDFKVVEYDLFSTPCWFDEGLKAVQDKIILEINTLIIERQMELLKEELRTTTQRVNLFEKVKIPETRENIRKIQIYLGDQQVAAVGRAKIAKSKLTGVS